MRTWCSGQPGCLIIAEIAQAHDGSLGAAHAYIDAVARAGADAVKFQTHIAEAESTPAEPWRVRFSLQDERRYEYWKRTAFTEAQWTGLAAHAQECGLAFLSSAFSIQAVEMLERIGVPAWKVGAGEITNLPMIERMAQTRKPVLLSSGMAGWSDLDAAVALVRSQSAPVAVFQCTSVYPCPPEKIGLNVIPQIRSRYQCAAGLSDHSGTIYPSLAAVALGAEMIEVHVTFSRECFGPDVSSSVTTQELAQLAAGVRFLEKALAHPVDKDAERVALHETRSIFGRSLVAARELPAGHTISAADLVLKKPGTGIPPHRLAEIVSRRLRRDVGIDMLLSEEDLEQPAAS